MKTAIYIRVSTEDRAREGYSLEVQREYLESYAEREGLEAFVRLQTCGENFFELFHAQRGLGRFAARTMA